MSSRAVPNVSCWLLALALSPPIGASTSQQTDPEAMPPGAARDLLFTACVGCHTLDTVTGATKSPAEWEATIYDMMSRGAQIFPDEVDSLVRYLDENLNCDVAEPAKARH